MLSLQRTLTFGYMSQRRSRTALIVLSIALGVATLVATRALSEHLVQAGDAAVNPFTEGVDLIVDKGQTGVPAALVKKLAKVEGVKKAEPLVVGFVLIPKPKRPKDQPPDPGEPEPRDRFVQLFGRPIDAGRWRARGEADTVLHQVEWHTADPENPELEVLGRVALRQRVVLVGADLAKKLPKEAVRTRKFEVQATAGEPTVVRWVGTVHLPEEMQKKLGSHMLFMRLEDAAQLAMKRPTNVTRIDVTFEDGYDRAAVKERVGELVGRQVSVRTVEESNASVRDITKGLQLGFMLGGVGALVVGLFLVYNALAVSVAERRHDIGILRSTGATRAQVARLFLCEALGLGLAGSLLGLPAGYFLARGALGPVRGVLEELFSVTLQARDVPLAPLTVVLALAAGPLTAVLAALVPALQAAQEEPADAVRRAPVGVGVVYRALHLGATALLLGAGLGCILLRAELPRRAGAYGGVVFLLVGALVATPLLAGVLARFIQPIFRRVPFLEGRLAADNLVRSPGRTGLVIGALAATGALLVQTAGFIKSTEVALTTWIDEKIAADLFVLSGGSRNSAGLPMRADVGERLRADPRVQTVLPVRGHQVNYESPGSDKTTVVFLIAVEVEAMLRAESDVPLARTFQQHPRLTQPHTAMVSENFAALNNVRVGQTITVQGNRGPVPLEVIGTLQDYTWNRGTIIVNRAWYKDAFDDHQIDLFDVWLRPGEDRAAVAKSLGEQEWARERLLVIATREQAQDAIVGAIRKLYGLLYVQQFIVGLVALLGVVSALFISVLQRRRELGLLRAVGASRGQVLVSVLAEATLMGLLGSVIGFAVGLVLEWYVVRILLHDEAGWAFPMIIPWRACLWVFVASVGLATLAGLWPAYRATKMRIPDAIAYE